MNMEEGERMRNGETLARIFKAWNSSVKGDAVSGCLSGKRLVVPRPARIRAISTPRSVQPTGPAQLR